MRGPVIKSRNLAPPLIVGLTPIRPLTRKTATTRSPSLTPSHAL